VHELLANIVEAHGGFDRWRRFNRVAATIVTGGAVWGMKNLTEDQAPRRMSVSLHDEVSSVAPFGDPTGSGGTRGSATGGFGRCGGGRAGGSTENPKPNARARAARVSGRDRNRRRQGMK
jgi:hypothetical protein